MKLTEVIDELKVPTLNIKEGHCGSYMIRCHYKNFYLAHIWSQLIEESIYNNGNTLMIASDMDNEGEWVSYDQLPEEPWFIYTVDSSDRCFCEEDDEN